jgi:hypothetical protein
VTYRRIGVLVIVLWACAGCNLTRALPTPTPDPRPPTATNPPPLVPTLFPSITPLGGVGTVPDQGECPIPQGWIEYVVQPGDSLSVLAENVGSTVEALVAANCLTDPNNLIADQPIYLPRIPIVGG